MTWGETRFVAAAGLRWHVRETGSGPDLLLLHGTGASADSWRGLVPLLAPHFRVLAPDLPGHARSESAPGGRITLPGMARAVDQLLRACGAAPALAIGHSAGAAILARMCLDGRIAPAALAGVNGAFLPFRGPLSQFFPPLARLLALNPLVPWAVARRAGEPATVARILADTGSALDADGVATYARLAGDPAHVAGALAMMASWNLRPLERDLPGLRTPLALLVGMNDRAVAPAEAFEIKARIPGAELIRLPGLGHLAHEEGPDLVARHVLDIAARRGVLAAAT